MLLGEINACSVGEEGGGGGRTCVSLSLLSLAAVSPRPLAGHGRLGALGFQYGFGRQSQRGRAADLLMRGRMNDAIRLFRIGAQVRREGLSSRRRSPDSPDAEPQTRHAAAAAPAPILPHFTLINRNTLFSTRTRRWWLRTTTRKTPLWTLL